MASNDCEENYQCSKLWGSHWTIQEMELHLEQYDFKISLFSWEVVSTVLTDSCFLFHHFLLRLLKRGPISFPINYRIYPQGQNLPAKSKSTPKIRYWSKGCLLIALAPIKRDGWCLKMFICICTIDSHAEGTSHLHLDACCAANLPMANSALQTNAYFLCKKNVFFVSCKSISLFIFFLLSSIGTFIHWAKSLCRCRPRGSCLPLWNNVQSVWNLSCSGRPYYLLACIIFPSIIRHCFNFDFSFFQFLCLYCVGYFLTLLLLHFLFSVFVNRKMCPSNSALVWH